MKMFNHTLSDKTWIPPWKRALDISLVLLALPFLIPIVVVIALVIRVVSEGPVLFKQERMGKDGKKFLCYKFRTMFVGVDSISHESHLQRLMQSDVPMTKMDAQGDSRIIPGGIFLRATGLDELPQLINVLRGEMSIVGPRPCLPYEFERYLPWQLERCNVAPGLTGLWQVSGKNKMTFTEMIRLDIEYSRRRSLMLDIEIIFKTVPALLGQVRETPAKKPAPKIITGERETILSVPAANR